jgi:hypothetical protein
MACANWEVRRTEMDKPMTAPDIIEIAKKAGLLDQFSAQMFADMKAEDPTQITNLERFAALYREALIASGEVVERGKVDTIREQWKRRKYWIEQNSGDSVALQFALNATNEDIDEAIAQDRARSQP